MAPCVSGTHGAGKGQAMEFVRPDVARAGTFVESFVTRAAFNDGRERMEKLAAEKKIKRVLVYTVVPVGKHNVWQIYLMP